MGPGIFCGFAAALLNSIGYIFCTRFLLHYRSPLRLLLFSHALMIFPASLLLLWLHPWAALAAAPWDFLRLTLGWLGCYSIGQVAFNLALRHLDASRVASLLGLKIVVLAAMFVLSGSGILRPMQIWAVLLATLAAMVFGRTGTPGRRACPAGWVMLGATLVLYSSVDLLFSGMTCLFQRVSFGGPVRSALATVSLLFTVFGSGCYLVMLKYRPTARQFVLAAPHTVLWLGSQLLIVTCYSLVLPVYGNVILASRGIISVIIGALLPLFGWGKFDSRIPARLWIFRIAAALLMLAAIVLYNCNI